MNYAIQTGICQREVTKADASSAVSQIVAGAISSFVSCHQSKNRNHQINDGARRHIVNELEYEIEALKRNNR